MVKIGCCGFPVSRKRYYKVFDVIEVQKTFYQIPQAGLLKKWRDETPDDFEFVVKAWQLITHPETSPTYRKTKESFKNCGFFQESDCVEYGIEKTLECARILGSKIIVFQTPASFRETEENIFRIVKFFNGLKPFEFKYGWEHRGSWNKDALEYIYSETGLFEIVDPFKTEPIKLDFIYFRLHGIGGYRYEYTEEDLLKIKDFADRNGYIMFNNTNMFNDAKRFKEMVSAQRA